MEDIVDEARIYSASVIEKLVPVMEQYSLAKLKLQNAIKKGINDGRTDALKEIMAEKIEEINKTIAE